MKVPVPATQREWQRRALILFCSTAIAFPLAARGSSCGHDFDFHLQSWLSVTRHWHEGTFYPHWIESSNYGAGEPRFVFYPPLSWMLGAFLGTVLPWASVPLAFTLIVAIACGFSMYQLASDWLPRDAATLSACAYILNPYALFVVYERTAYAELTAGIWLPLMILFALRSSRHEPCEPRKPGIAQSPDEPHFLSYSRIGARVSNLRSQFSQPTENDGSLAARPLPAMSVFRDQALVPLSLSIAAIWLTNAPAAVISCYFLAMIALWTAVARRQWRPILRSSAAVIVGMGLAAFYLVPAARERRWVDISRAIGPGMRIQDSFLFEHSGASPHDEILRTASWIFIIMLAVTTAAGWMAGRRGFSRGALAALFATAAVLLTLQLPWSAPVWTHAPELKFLQFPWRFSLVLEVLLALALGAACASHPGAESSRRTAVLAALILVAAVSMVTTGSWLFWQPCDEEDAVSAQLSLFQSGAGSEGTDEYTTLGADNAAIPQGLPRVRVLNSVDTENPRIHLASGASGDEQQNPVYVPDARTEIPAEIQTQQWSTEHRLISIQTAASGYAVLRLMDYPAWLVLANRVRSPNRPQRNDGLMSIPIQPGLTIIEVAYTVPPDTWWGRGLSAAATLALLALAIVRRERSSGRI